MEAAGVGEATAWVVPPLRMLVRRWETALGVQSGDVLARVAMGGSGKEL